jgi:hypothetical protein
MTSFDGMPRTATDAEAKGWRSISAKDCTNGGKFFGNRYVLGDDIAMALLFDRNGIIAGIQVNVSFQIQITKLTTYCICILLSMSAFL